RDRNVTGVQTCALPIWRRVLDVPSQGRPPRPLVLHLVQFAPGADRVPRDGFGREGLERAGRDEVGADPVRAELAGNVAVDGLEKIGRASCRERAWRSRE